MQRFINTSPIVVFLGLVTVWAGCGGSGTEIVPAQPATETAASAETTDIEVPGWFLNIPVDQNYTYSAATGSSENSRSAVDKAMRQAYLDIASQIEVKVSQVVTKDPRLFKCFREEIGAEEDLELLTMMISVSTVPKQLVSEVVKKARVIKEVLKKEDGVYHAYVLMGMPIGQLKDRARAQLDGSRVAAEEVYHHYPYYDIRVVDGDIQP